MSSVIQGGLISPLVSEVAGLSIEVLTPIISSGVSLLERGLTSLSTTSDASVASASSRDQSQGARRAAKGEKQTATKW